MKELDIKKIPRPAGHRIIVKPDHVEEVSKGGIVIASSNKDREQDSYISGRIMAIGPTAWNLPQHGGVAWANVGDRVMYASYAGYALKINGEMYRVMNDEDITAIIEE